MIKPPQVGQPTVHRAAVSLFYGGIIININRDIAFYFGTSILLPSRANTVFSSWPRQTANHLSLRFASGIKRRELPFSFSFLKCCVRLLINVERGAPQ